MRFIGLKLCLLCFFSFLSVGSFASARVNHICKDDAVSSFKPIKRKVGYSSTTIKIIKAKFGTKKGSIMLFPPSAVESDKTKTRNRKVIDFFTTHGFDVISVSYPLQEEDKYSQEQLRDVINLYQSLRRQLKSGPQRLDIVGFNSGASLAAEMLERLSKSQQPDHVILFSPSLFDQTIPGTVIPKIIPPLDPRSKLFVLFSSEEKKNSFTSCTEYIKKYVGFGGSAVSKVMRDSFGKSNAYGAHNLLFAYPGFFNNFQEVGPTDTQKENNPAGIAKQGYSLKRHEEKLLLVSKEKFNLIMIGNSITNNFEKPEYQSVWKQFFEPRKTLNLGFSGYRTENILWNIEHGELDGQSPKVVVLEIGTNNIDEKNYPTRHTAIQLADGIEAIVKLLRRKLPNTKIILLRGFPGSYDGPLPTSHRAILERASELVSRMHDGKYIFYCDVNHVFLNLDGSIDRSKMDDYLHPTPQGTKDWVEAMEPLLAQLMMDKTLANDNPLNTAIIPVSKLEQDSYDWFGRHAEVMALKDSINPEIVLIGNSITHFWGGLPSVRYANGNFRVPNGEKSYNALFSPYRVMNLGFGWDRTQNVLWRLDHGELNGLHPRLVILDIGTNNTSETGNARMNTASEIVEGIRAICGRIRSKIPNIRIVIMAVFPREKDPFSSRRLLITEINRQLADFAALQQISFVDIGPKMLNTDGTFIKDIMLDFTHPSEKGYSIWAEELKPYIKNELLR